MMLSLMLLHGTDPRMELIYFLASVLTVLLPVSIFIYMAYRLFRTFLREKREEAAAAAARETHVSP
jgi:hypothetical protein